MENMAEEEDIWQRHALQSPHCQLVIREKGQGYIDEVIRRYGPYSEEVRTPAIRVSNLEHEEFTLTSINSPMIYIVKLIIFVDAGDHK